MDSGMDVKKDVTEGFGNPSESLVPPSTDVEDEIEGPVDSGEDASIIQQLPTSPDDNQVLLNLPDLDSDPCYPRAEEIRIGLDGDGESKRSSEPQDTTSLDPEISRNGTEEGAKASAQEENICWTPKPDQVSSEVESDLKIAIDQSEILKELEEKDVEEEIPEADQPDFLQLFARLQRLNPGFHDKLPTSEDDLLAASDSEESHGLGDGDRRPLLEHPEDFQGSPDKVVPSLLHVATGQGLRAAAQHLLRSVQGQRSGELLSSETNQENLLSLLHYEGGVSMEEEEDDRIALAHSDVMIRTGCQKMEVEGTAVAPGKFPPEPACDDLEERRRKGRRSRSRLLKESTGLEAAASSDSNLEARSWEGSSDPVGEPALNRMEDSSPTSDPVNKGNVSSFPPYKDVPGPCDPEDLLEGVIFGAKYLGSTQLVSEKNPSTSIRMAQAQEAVDRIKAPEGESQPMTEVDLFVSTQRIKVLSADTQETMMDHPLQTISYIADIGNIVVLMARRKLPRRADASTEKQLYKMICHVFHSSDAQLIAQAIGQVFSVAYQHFLRASGIDPSQLGSVPDQNDDEKDPGLIEGEELYNGDLAHFSKQENCKEVVISKQKGEILGVVIVESGWGSILPTVVIANLMHRGAAERSGKLSIGDRIMSINGTSLVGLPLASCQNIIRDLKNQTEVILSIVHCPPVTTAIVRRPGTKYPLGFSVENGIICSLMRGGIAERGGVRVGHRIIEINGQSVVAMPHEKIIHILSQAVSEVHIKTMPASTYRLLTGQEQPIFL
ncbi:amyloid-beta A4 precursor protein-binding family A member 3-like isoform X1 [Pantherophis guttatus]|uniref:Amyloid-beta A4 precursor protein-binding family A member 3 n=1 Tax=Pantherophis guttatus TaxID=94885 RepID=A0A6P9CH84_PANGU|nr:amyloid-beta A4 precursor protein-binding family A member 3-like isoform X1 [Pantherophis guttatus]XP_034278527.1 amyloid-beta A4 precursor protein-binding family A member 3-like isoform X1 [Pantherophis guttatus]